VDEWCLAGANKSREPDEEHGEKNSSHHGEGKRTLHSQSPVAFLATRKLSPQRLAAMRIDAIRSSRSAITCAREKLPAPLRAVHAALGWRISMHPGI